MKCTFKLTNPPNLCTNITAPVRGAGMPRARAMPRCHAPIARAHHMLGTARSHARQNISPEAKRGGSHSDALQHTLRLLVHAGHAVERVQ
jgi:hypothetical protein